LFHEFGHGLHGLLSNVTYGRIGGTNVLQDFVELPSQLFEHWGTNPDLLRQYACHFKTGESISEALIEKIQAAATFNMGFETVEYCACCLMDLALHEVETPDDLDLSDFEKSTLSAIGMPDEIVMRHRLPHFGHLFSGDYYAAGYYVYLWAEVLDADAFEAFKETGNLFDPNTAQRLRQHIYGAGASVAPMKTYLAFRGKQPVVEPMLKGRGLL
jgi:peptidyl-dipeptidase Dcp